jgi:hypothetical protein
MRSRSSDHRVTFEFLQSDLESTVETLSDIVARKRLRASKSQITQAVQATKQKRIEFETFLSSYAAAKASSAPNTQTMNRLEALTSRNTARSRNRGGAGGHHHTSRNNTANRLTQRLHDLDDARELSALLLELELANSLGSGAGGSGGEEEPSRRATTNTGSGTRRRSHRTNRRRNRSDPSRNLAAVEFFVLFLFSSLF